MSADEPIVLVPGLACDATIWRHQVAALGNGRSITVANHGEAASLAEMAEQVLDTVPARFALAGHSMGARVALEIVDRAPERVTRLALLDTGVHPVRPGEAAARNDLLDFGRAFGMPAMIDRWLPPMVHPDRINDAAIMAPLRAMAIGLGFETFERQVGALLGRRDATPILAKLHCPVLVGVGSHDSWSTPEQHRSFVRNIAHATLVVFDQAGHMAPFERPELVNAAMAYWLDAPATPA
jgi:pimeloyl-ACP methyl ester carboxylesterase